MNTSSLIGLVAAGLLMWNAAFAEDHVVSTKLMSFEPLVVQIKPGDQVVWRNMTGHMVKSLLIPDGAEGWQSNLGEDFTHKFDKPGAYLYNCVPHASLGMVGVVLVGDGMPGNYKDLEAKSATGSEHRAFVKLKQYLTEKGILK
jgi:pseudoazurin